MPSVSTLIGIDIGAGSGAKLGLFDPALRLLAEDVLPKDAYGGTVEAMAEALAERIRALSETADGGFDAVRGIGIVTPGLLNSDGSYLLAANIDFLTGENLPAHLGERLDRPVRIENDANAGGLAEWSLLRLELLYWVFGGGWGGAWIDGEGAVRHPALDWDREDAHLHPTNEPGYSIPLPVHEVRLLFAREGVSWERFEEILLQDLAPEDGVLRGPSGRTDALRAEAILSGPGRCRLFRAVTGTDESYARLLTPEEAVTILNPGEGGGLLSRLSRLGIDAAIRTDRLFGRILAEAGAALLKRAHDDGCPETAPVCLGGGPARAFPWFGPFAQAELARRGFLHILRPSLIDERGGNANLIGSAVVAEQAAEA